MIMIKIYQSLLGFYVILYVDYIDNHYKKKKT
jgi:hypothetical protein